MNELINLFISFLKIGFLGFGGGYAMLSMILEESMSFELSLAQFADLNALDMVVPGPIAINSATYVGYLISGILGATIATFAVSIPSFTFATLFHHFSDFIPKNQKVSVFLRTIKPSVVGLIVSAAFTLTLGIIFQTDNFFTFIQHPFENISLFSLAIFLASVFAQIKYNISPILLTIIAGLIGYVAYYVI